MKNLLFLSMILLVNCSKMELASVSKSQTPQKNIIFQDVSVFNGSTMLRNQDVLVTGSTITSVTQTGTNPLLEDAIQIDGTGRTLLPGLIDIHIHVFSAGEKDILPPDPKSIGGALLYAGITSALITADPDDATKLVLSSRDGTTLAPHLYTSGPGLTAPGGHPIPLLRAMLPWPIRYFAIRSVFTAANSDEAQQQTRRIVEKFQPDFLKIIYDDLPPGAPHLSYKSLKAAITEAKNNGVRPIVHATTTSDAVEAAEAGAALLVHIPQRGILDYEQIKRLVATKVPVVTTVNLITASRDLSSGGPSILEKSMVDPKVLEVWQKEPAWDLPGFSDEIDTTYGQVAEETRINFQKLLDGGVSLLIGTDSGVHGVFPGSSLHREIETVVNLGMPPLDALKAVTSASALFLDPEGSFGFIRAGQRADLLLVKGDPSSDITTVSKIEKVFLEGVEIKRQAL
ncbi:MAG: amidohydrolase family protein [Candidatus Neomarinimicrobiota bacterium]